MGKRIMIPSEKRTWLSALRSGLYKQASGKLRQVEERYDSHTRKYEEVTVGHCCLGVAACVIKGRQPKRGTSLLRPGTFGLSKALQYALAIANDGDKLSERRKAFKAAGFDDIPEAAKNNGRSNFKSIADWINKNL